MIAFVGPTLLIEHLTGQPSKAAVLATTFLRTAERVLLTDVVLADLVTILESELGVDRGEIANLGRAIIGQRSVSAVDEPLLLRALMLYEREPIRFVEAYLRATAERTGIPGLALDGLRAPITSASPA